MDSDASEPLVTPAPWHELAPNVVGAFAAPESLLLSSTGVATTVVFSPGLDHPLRVDVRRSFGSDSFGDVALITGYLTPVVLPLGMHATGLVAHNRPLAVHGAAATQAVALTFVTTTLLKVVTGRPFPLHGGDPRAPDRFDHPEYAREWLSAPWRGNLAWPSGHTSAAFAVASSLSASTSSIAVSVVAYAAATAVGAGMLAGDRHWASDVLAGALLGQAIGGAVGRGFRGRFLGVRDTPALTLVPRITETEIGLVMIVPAFR